MDLQPFLQICVICHKDFLWRNIKKDLEHGLDSPYSKTIEICAPTPPPKKPWTKNKTL